jgi:hypothetical protein
VTALSAGRVGRSVTAAWWVPAAVSSRRTTNSLAGPIALFTGGAPGSPPPVPRRASTPATAATSGASSMPAVHRAQRL